MTVNSHMSIWLIVAKHFNVHPRSLQTFLKHSSEGLPYFYQKLPMLGKALEFGLDSGHFDITTVPFRKRKGSVLPLFLYELFKQVFDDEGYVRGDPMSIRELRQLLMMFYKFEEEPTATQVAEANQQFVNRDSLVGFNNLSGNYPSSLIDVRKNFQSLLPDDPKDISLHHSSGATADQICNSEKVHTFHETPAMAHHGIDMIFLDASHASACQHQGYIDDKLPPARVVQVPKDARGPRSICCEPHTNMKYQLGLMLKIYDYVENSSPAKGYVNFTDQSTNRRLAQMSSMDRSLTTIDLKDASDMVSWDLIQEIVSEEWLETLMVTRSTHARVGDTLVEFKKFAPMGSALCFPIEAILFWSIARTAATEVWVYGDDIIVASKDAHNVIEALESYSLIVNRSKTLHDGFFRESCGGDYYRGEAINYIKCKSYELDRYIAFANLFGDAYGRNLSDELMTWYEKHNRVQVYRRPLSEAARPESYVYYTEHISSSDVFFEKRWNKDLQLSEVRRLMERPNRGFRTSLLTNRLDIAIKHNPTIADIVARIYSRNLDERNLLMHWFQGVNSLSPLQQTADTFVERLLGVEPRVRVGFMPDYRLSGHAAPKPRTNFGWGVHHPVRALTG